MTKESTIYVGMILITAPALYLIFYLGSSLQAPESLAGSYDLQPTAKTTTSYAHLTINQSGQFFDLQFDDTPHLPCRWAHPTHPPLGQPLTADLSAPDNTITLSGLAGGDTFQLSLANPVPATFVAHRKDK